MKTRNLSNETLPRKGGKQKWQSSSFKIVAANALAATTYNLMTQYQQIAQSRKNKGAEITLRLDSRSDCFPRLRVFKSLARET